MIMLHIPIWPRGEGPLPCPSVSWTWINVLDGNGIITGRIIMEAHSELPLDKLLHLTALEEVVGAFAHEIAQPVNAMGLTVQVLQLKLSRIPLSDTEKAYFVERLNKATSEAARARQILDDLREFTRGKLSATGYGGLDAVFQKIQTLMSRQLMNRGIELRWESQGVDRPLGWEPHTAEGVLIHGLAFARDTVQAIAVRHEEEGLPYTKLVEAKLREVPEGFVAEISWDSGELPWDTDPVDPEDHAGLELAKAVFLRFHGSLETDRGKLRMVFPVAE